MKVYLVHHVDALSAAQDAQRHISPMGCDQADRLGSRWRAMGVYPVRILHSELQWSIDTAVRIAAKLGASDKVAKAAYSINTGDPIAPFMAEIASAESGKQGDIMMCGHVDYLLRSASHLVCGDEKKKVVEFKPGNGTAVCVEGSGNDWAITYAWRQDHAPG